MTITDTILNLDNLMLRLDEIQALTESIDRELTKSENEQAVISDFITTIKQYPSYGTLKSGLDEVFKNIVDREVELLEIRKDLNERAVRSQEMLKSLSDTLSKSETMAAKAYNLLNPNGHDLKSQTLEPSPKASTIIDSSKSVTFEALESKPSRFADLGDDDDISAPDYLPDATVVDSALSSGVVPRDTPISISSDDSMFGGIDEKISKRF